MAQAGILLARLAERFLPALPNVLVLGEILLI